MRYFESVILVSAGFHEIGGYLQRATSNADESGSFIEKITNLLCRESGSG
jgi:hypothetical protein